MKDKTFKELSPFSSGFKGTDVLFKDTSVSAGVIQSNGIKKKSPERKQRWLIEWRTMIGARRQWYHSAPKSLSQLQWRFFHLGGRGNKEAKRLGVFFQGAWPDGRGVLIGFAVCLQGKVAGGNGGNEVWREGTVLSSQAPRRRCQQGVNADAAAAAATTNNTGGSVYYTFQWKPAESFAVSQRR